MKKKLKAHKISVLWPDFSEIVHDAASSAGIKTDMKSGMGKKPPLSHVSIALLNYTARATQFGSTKYALGNYLLPPPEGMTDEERLLNYIDAAMRHLTVWSDSIIRFIGGGRNAEKTLQEACYARDADSGLPHACGAGASLSMALQQAADAGLMPLDPGITWKDKK